ncbi:MAG: hypothetical protein KF691_00935 [Phycisphaeraceae bacterium]|nr:hypothetical protein [Phycisphaeraceae bacterium]
MTIEDLVRAMQSPFPNLTGTNIRLTSPYDEGYNCIAWAAEDTDYWWWPDAMGLHYWPPGVPREETVEAFMAVYGLQGYLHRSDPALEAGKQKVAIFADSKGKPTHAARQLRDGWWASKLGQQVDIEHEFSALDGPTYGTVAVILARPAN